ncbi:MAG: L-seryl-tRNA(Sec) selenium transferase [Chloroflexi bacterium]|nr:L-seryl-tRNA(Sec) selenium transferase [Chloroflexota bacterium]
MPSELRKLPSVDSVLQQPEAQAAVPIYGRELVSGAVRMALDEARQRVLGGAACPAMAEVLSAVADRLAALAQPTLQLVINATGVIIHTNLGRAPLSAATIAAMQQAAVGYSNLEYDLEQGQRGSRYAHAEGLLCRLTGAEAALLVNNNAGAVLLALSALAQGREVVISRGQLVEIGGGFRIPDVMAQSGALLREVGTTNRTRLRDYEAAIGEQTALLMRVHTSNFKIIGFVQQVELDELVRLGRERRLPVVDDLGSGTLLDTSPYGLTHEPTVQESVAAGADIVTFSGDKLLGGPQAGIIVGRGELVERLRRHPLTRALRVDKTAIAGIQANLLHYLKGEAAREIPVWRMIALPLAELEARAQALAAQAARLGVAAQVVDGQSTIGGGSLPGEMLPTRLVALPVRGADALARALRRGQPAVVGRIEDDRLLLDLRTVLPGQDEALAGCLARALAS